MSDLGTMTVKINGDLTGLDSQLKKGGQSLKTFSKQSASSLAELTDKLKYFQDQAFGEKDLNKLKTYNKGINDTKAEMASLANVGTSSLGALGSGATKAYSIIRQAAYILPGIGIAGIIAFATDPIMKYVSTLFEASDAVKKLKKDNEELAEKAKGFFEGSAKEASGVGALIAVLKNETETRERKNQALKELQKINPDIFNSLKLEQGAVIGIDNAYKNYLENFKNVIAAKILQAKLEKAITVLLEAQGVTQDGRTKSLLNGFKAQSEAQAKLLRGSGQPGMAQEVERLAESFDKIKTDKIAKANSEVEGLGLQLKELSKGVEIKIDDQAEKKVKTAKRSIQDVLLELRQNIKALNLEESFFKEDKTTERVNAFTSTIKTLVTKFKQDPSNDLIKGLLDETKFAKAGFVFGGNLLKFGLDLQKKLKTLGTSEPLLIVANLEFDTTNSFTKQLKEGLGKELKGFNLKVNLNDSFEALTNKLQIAQAKAKEVNENIRATTQATIANIAVGVFDSIGKAISGKGSFADIFTGIFQQLAGGLKTLGKYLVETGIKIQIAKSLLFKNPIAGIAAGAALIILGAAIESKFQKTPGFANGVNNFGGGVALVGENGPELVNLPRGADVIPNNKLGGRIGGGTNDVNVTGQFALRGVDLVAVINKANQQIRRNA